jgi:ornithine cyclodeaminase/alanine dehydrogenase-like protein (mu-crystallin family)
VTRWLSAAEVADFLTPELALSAVGAALDWCRLGTAQAPSRDRLEHDGILLLSMRASAAAGIAAKVLTLNGRHIKNDNPTIQGVLLIFDPETGTLRGALDGGSVTAIRTAAIASWATDRLAPLDASHMLLVGAGAQARWQVDGILSVRNIQKVAIWNRTTARAAALVTALERQHPDVSFGVADDLRTAARAADVITLVTASRDPILELQDLSGTCHINAMGAHEPDTRELSSDIMAHADVYADTVSGCLEEAGDMLIPMTEGVLNLRDVRPLAEADASHSEITVMKSVGSAIFDLACGALLLDTLDERGVRDGVDSRLALLQDT